MLSHEIFDAIRHSVVNRIRLDYDAAIESIIVDLSKDIYTEESAKSVFLDILNLLSKYGWRQQIDMPEIYRLTHCETMKEVLCFLEKEAADIFQFEKITDVCALDALRIISREYSNANLSIGYICEQLNVSKSKLCGVFRFATGMSINEYINHYRIIVAKEAIKQGDLSLKVIAQKTGFNDLNYFSKTFKKHMGLTPGAYKEREK